MSGFVAASAQHVVQPRAAERRETWRLHSRPVYDEVMKSRIYVDTSVVGGCEDEEFSEHSVRLMEDE